ARAEELAGILDGVAAENRRMYAEQRGISQTLQHALLPEALPQVRGLRVIASYVPAASGVEVGGDWYDLVAIDDRQAFLLIGDVAQLQPDAPIGVPWEARYREATVSVPSKAVVVAFTDGLVERRGEVIDVGLARLRDLATRQRLALDDLLAQLAVGLAAEDHN